MEMDACVGRFGGLASLGWFLFGGSDDSEGTDAQLEQSEFIVKNTFIDEEQPVSKNIRRASSAPPCLGSTSGSAIETATWPSSCEETSIASTPTAWPGTPDCDSEQEIQEAAETVPEGMFFGQYHQQHVAEGVNLADETSNQEGAWLPSFVYLPWSVSQGWGQRTPLNAMAKVFNPNDAAGEVRPCDQAKGFFPETSPSSKQRQKLPAMEKCANPKREGKAASRTTHIEPLEAMPLDVRNQFVSVANAGHTTLTGCAHVDRAVATEGPHGWTLAAHFKPRLLRHCRHVLGCAKDAMLQAAQRLENVRIIGSDGMRIEITPSGLGTSIVLASFDDDKAEICAAFNKDGKCCKSYCTKVHPKWQASIDITAKLTDS